MCGELFNACASGNDGDADDDADDGDTSYCLDHCHDCQAHRLAQYLLITATAAAVVAL